MKVKILEIPGNTLKDAMIREGGRGELPSMHEGWRFNFARQLQKLSNAKAYVLVAANTPAMIEGCLVFQMKERQIPYMAFLEVAPHNRGKSRRYDHVAGCLIAFAYRQSLVKGKGDYKGLLFFNVHEKDEKDAAKLMRNYSGKYHAKRVAGTSTMVISDEGGEELLARYLK